MRISRSNTLQLKGQSVLRHAAWDDVSSPVSTSSARATNSFRGAISGLGFHVLRIHPATGERRSRTAFAGRKGPLGSQPLGLRSSLAADNKIIFIRSPGRSCTSWWRAHKACLRDP
jgi:hypothetical protein